VSPAIGDLVAEATATLAVAGIEAPQREARLLLAALLDLSPASIFGYPERPVAADRAAAFRTVIARRAAHEPVSRILGRREFWSLPFRLGPATLDPRPDSETLVQAALDLIGDRSAPLRLVDFGTGSGCLLLALLSELPAAWGVGIDRSIEAAGIAAANAQALGLADRVRFAVGSWGEALAGPIDLIVSNPPYIPAGDIAGLAVEVRAFDPHLALDGGADGLDAYRALAPDLHRLLAHNGHAVLEIGQGQADPVTGILDGAGLVVTARCRDLAGIDRVLIARRA